MKPSEVLAQMRDVLETRGWAWRRRGSEAYRETASTR
jgi:hypothetical protein